MTQLVGSLALDGLTLTPLTPTIGAEVGGVDLRQPLEAGQVAAIRQALLDWKVLFSAIRRSTPTSIWPLPAISVA